MRAEKNKECLLSEISAYVDGELSSQEELALERHIANCPICFHELNEQKRLFCILDSALKKDPVDIPDLTDSFVVRAESSVSGLKNKHIFCKFAVLLPLILACLHHEFRYLLFDSFLLFAFSLRIAYETLNNLVFGLSVILKVFILKNSIGASLIFFFLIFVLISAFLKKSLSPNR